MWMLKHKQKSVHNKSKKWKKTSTDHRSARIWVVDELRFSLFFFCSGFNSVSLEKSNNFFCEKSSSASAAATAPPIRCNWNWTGLRRRLLFQIFTLIEEYRASEMCVRLLTDTATISTQRCRESTMNFKTSDNYLQFKLIFTTVRISSFNVLLTHNWGGL